MIPAGYLIKRVSPRPDWLKAEGVEDIFSVSNCISADFMKYVNYWKHNGHWLFDSLEVAQQLAREHNVDLKNTTPFYYEIYEHEFDEDEKQWAAFKPEESFVTHVQAPPMKNLEGYDIVSFSLGTLAECSPLSCNHLATEIQTNRHCLLDTFEQAHDALENGKFLNAEPGPFRVFAVYSVDWP